MIYTDDHDLVSSFREYLEWWLFDQKQCYQNVNSSVYAHEDTNFLNWNSYASPYAQFIHQLDVDNLTTTQVTNSAVPVGDVKISFPRGRLLTSNSGYTASNLKFEGGVKDFNIYITSSPIEKILFSEEFHFDKKLGVNTGLNPYSYHTPALFLQIAESRNDLFSAGGTIKTNWVISIVSIMPNEYYSTAIIGLLRDLKRKCFPLLGASNLPLNEYGELKDPSWRYKPFLANPTTVAGIEQVLYQKHSSDNFSEANPKLLVGIHDIHIRWINRIV